MRSTAAALLRTIFPDQVTRTSFLASTAVHVVVVLWGLGFLIPFWDLRLIPSQPAPPDPAAEATRLVLAPEPVPAAGPPAATRPEPVEEPSEAQAEAAEEGESSPEPSAPPSPPVPAPAPAAAAAAASEPRPPPPIEARPLQPEGRTGRGEDEAGIAADLPVGGEAEADPQLGPSAGGKDADRVERRARQLNLAVGFIEDRLRERYREAWRPRFGEPPLSEFTLVIRVNSDGDVLGGRFAEEHTTGDPALDRAILDWLVDGEIGTAPVRIDPPEVLRCRLSLVE